MTSEENHADRQFLEGRIEVLESMLLVALYHACNGRPKLLSTIGGALDEAIKKRPQELRYDDGWIAGATSIKKTLDGLVTRLAEQDDHKKDQTTPAQTSLRV